MKSGTTINGHTQTYIVEQELGAGATSRVYLATIAGSSEQVALKVLRPDVEETITQSFFLEADILQDLYEAEQQLDGQHAIPRLYETQRNPEPRFLALERVRGTSLEALLNSPPYYLEEPVALQITAQVARVLHVLHTQLRRSYNGFQFQNIYWDAEHNQVQVIDWNYVSEPNKGNPQTDLTLLGVYLYRMLTGKSASEHGETERELEHRGGDRWTALSLGCRRMIIQAVHPHPQRRFDTAAAMRESAEWLVAQWARTGLELALETGTYLDSEPARASILLDLARRRGGVPDTALNQIEARLDSTNPHDDAYAQDEQSLHISEQTPPPSDEGHAITETLQQLPADTSEAEANQPIRQLQQTEPLLSVPEPEPEPRRSAWLPVAIVATLMLLLLLWMAGLLQEGTDRPTPTITAVAQAAATRTVSAGTETPATAPTIATTVPQITTTLQVTMPVQEPETVVATTIPTITTTTTTSVAEPLMVSIDQTAFATTGLFDLPLRITGRSIPGTEVQLTINYPAAPSLVVSVATQDDGIWVWRPMPDEPALAAGDYTLIASTINPLTGETILAAPVAFRVQRAPEVTVRTDSPVYTQPSPHVALLEIIPAGTLLEVVGWTVVDNAEWYHVRRRTRRQLSWLQASQIEQSLNAAVQQELPRLP